MENEKGRVLAKAAKGKDSVSVSSQCEGTPPLTLIPDPSHCNDGQDGGKWSVGSGQQENLSCSRLNTHNS